MLSKSISVLAATAVLPALMAQPATKRDPAADWPMYRHDLAGTGYSTLSRINTRNVADLKQVWSYRLQSDAPAPGRGGRGAARGINSEATPIVVNGVLYVPTANSKALVANIASMASPDPLTVTFTMK